MPTSEVLIETLEAAGCEVTRNSGRGMFGRECVTVKNEPAWSVARGLPAGMDIPEPNQDALGHGTVVRPRFEWVGNTQKESSNE
jgi:hypothetical protein